MARKSSKLSSSSPLANLSAPELHAEIRRRQRGSKSLLRRREKLVAKMAAVNAEIEAAGVDSGGVRPRNARALPDALRAVLKGKTMGVTGVAKAVQHAGYQTTGGELPHDRERGTHQEGPQVQAGGAGDIHSGVIYHTVPRR